MNCDFSRHAAGVVKCSVCGREVTTPHPPELVHARCRAGRSAGRACRAKKPAPQSGPGTELKTLFARHGAPLPCDPCYALAAEMDRWGPDECERSRDEIVERLRKNLEENFGLLDRLKARVAGARAILAGDASILCPLRSLVDEAIARARELVLQSGPNPVTEITDAGDRGHDD